MSPAVETGDAFIRLLKRRIEFLRCLESSPQQKPELVARLEWSRSTVDRGVRELQQAGLVTRTKDGYTTTLAGRLAVTTYTEFTEMVSDIHTASPLLGTFDRNCSIPKEALVGVERIPIDDHTPFAVPTELRTAIESADGLTALVPVFVDPLLLMFCQSRAVEGSLDLDLIVGPKLYEALQHRPTEMFSVVSEQRFRRASRSPTHTILLIERTAGANEVIVIVYDDGTESALLRNQNRVAVETAVEYIESMIGSTTERITTTETNTPN